MYPILISLVIILLMLISPRKDISEIMNSSAGKFFMIVFLILAIQQNIFIGLLTLVIFLHLLTPNKVEGMTNANARVSSRPKSTNKTNENDPRNKNNSQDESDISKTEEKVSNGDENENENETTKTNIELSPEELTIVRNLIHNKKSNPKQKCRKNCGNALLSCLDGCQVSDQMRRPVSSKNVNVTKNDSTTENVEPTEESTQEGFATFEQNYMPF